jgi:hypothetical protein
MTRIGLRLPADLTFEEWANTGPKLFRVVDSAAWCLDDWLVYGREQYRDRYQQAVRTAGLDYQTLRNYAWVAGKVDISRRRGELSFQHHAEVAALPNAEQELWLERAVQSGWSKTQLRRNIRNNRSDAGDGDATVTAAPALRVPPAHLDCWRAAATQAGVDLKDWMVMTLNQAATQVLDRPGAS